MSLGFSLLKTADRFMWFELVFYGLIYTAIVVNDDRRSSGPHILSKQNTRPPVVIALGHLVFLTMSFVLSEVVSSKQLYFPDWFATERNKDLAALMVWYLLIKLLSYIERRLLCGGRLPHGPGLPKSPPEEDVP
jgi:hypothetical protein